MTLGVDTSVGHANKGSKYAAIRLRMLSNDFKLASAQKHHSIDTRLAKGTMCVLRAVTNRK